MKPTHLLSTKSILQLLAVFLVSTQMLSSPVSANIAQTSPFKKSVQTFQGEFQKQNSPPLDVNQFLKKIKHFKKIKAYNQYQILYPDTSKGQAELKKLYTSGDNTAGLILALYSLKLGLESKESLRLFEEVAETGDPMAQFISLCIKSLIVKDEKGVAEIISKFDALATQEGSFFKYMVGYTFAVLPPPFANENKAFQYVKEAYDSSEYIPEFSSSLGIFYLYGIGTKRQPDIAYGAT